MRVAFFGGTFDPIHRGHVRLAAAAAEAFALDCVLFAPVGLQPLKHKRPLASFTDRMAMTALAIADPANRTLIPAKSSFLLSHLDAPSPDGTPNYTVNTLRALAHEYPNAELFVLTGADSFLSMRKWRSPDQLLSLAEWIVVSRPEFPLGPGFLERPKLALKADQRARIHLLTTVHEDVSATELRRRLRSGGSSLGLLAPTVAAYIQEHHLYR